MPTDEDRPKYLHTDSGSEKIGKLDKEVFAEIDRVFQGELNVAEYHGVDWRIYILTGPIRLSRTDMWQFQPSALVPLPLSRIRMVTGPFHGPRPLLSIECFLIVYEYTAQPTETLSGGTSPDRSGEFRQAAAEHLPVDRFVTEAHSMQPDLFGDVLLAELDTDRLRLNRYMAFVEEYASLIGTDDLRVVNTGIDARTRMDIEFPRPLVDADVEALLKFEITHAGADMKSVAAKLESEFKWIDGYEVPTDEITLLQHTGGPNDLVLTQVLDLVEELRLFGIDQGGVTVTCSVIEG